MMMTIRHASRLIPVLIPVLMRASIIALAIGLAIGLAGCGDSVTESPEPLADQEALSKIAKDRHYTIDVYHEGLADIGGEPVHVFAERTISKFGGSSTRLFTLPRDSLSLESDVGHFAGPDALRRDHHFFYNHDEGVFELRTTRGENTLPDKLIETIEADFEESFTLVQERCQEAVATVAEDPADVGRADYAAAICIHSGDIELARNAATRLLDLGGGLSGDSRGYAQHKGHTHLGRIALLDGDVSAAIEHLSRAAAVTPSATMSTFGPNMALARDLLEAGETEPVLDYLSACATFWNPDQIEAWSEEVRRGEMPDFGGNLNY